LEENRKRKQQRIYEFKLKQGYLYMRDMIILNIIAFVEMLLFMLLSMLIWYKYTSFSSDDFIRYSITIGFFVELCILVANEKFIKWFSRRRLSWIRKRIKRMR
jgi:hypothetical protein